MDSFGGEWQFEADLAELLAQSTATTSGNGNAPFTGAAYEPYEYSSPAPRPSAARSHRRRNRLLRLVARLRRPGPVLLLRWLSLLIATTTAAIVTMMSVLGGMISYDPMRHLASLGVSPGLAGWWPLLVFGPWLVASLSILRAAVHQRHVSHSWAVVVFFSLIAVYLCVAHAQKTVTSMAVAGLPPVTALVSFHQLVRQITLTNPPKHALPRQRSTPGQSN
ncbi:DUF2637 domain-containing protein [Streptomyces sp. RB6PN25]|uniref:DUF2637 domain-containing protein n=1 Tax=Streptomyces humicola TaxID=2953240 RepID=A0ABT1Q6N6_9ACTN|nr:DUF2637 domain-containing protein [Streptomyces humicola]MCQ4085045.1 DUF2637 domain-containing protein [Streptomyces humicola]